MDRSAVAPPVPSAPLSRFAPTLLLVALADLVLRVPVGLGATLFVLVAATCFAARQPVIPRSFGPGARPPTALHWPLAWSAFATNAVRALPVDALRAWRDRTIGPRSRRLGSWTVPLLV